MAVGHNHKILMQVYNRIIKGKHGHYREVAR